MQECPRCGTMPNIPANKRTCCLRRGHRIADDVKREVAAAEDPSLPSDFPDEITMRVRRALMGQVASVTDLANTLDVSPRRVESSISWLREHGFAVATKEDGAPASVMIGAGAVRRPEIRINADKFYQGTRFRFGLVSDTHLCSQHYRPEVLHALYDAFAAQGIRHVFHGGNWIEGDAKFNRFDVTHHGISAQTEFFVREYPKRDGITTYIVSGDDHEGWYQQREGIDVGAYMEMTARKMGRADLVNLGYLEADVAITAKKGQCILRVVHAGGGSAYALSYAPQKIVESYEGGEKPQILVIGHYHKADYMLYRNVHVFQMGTTKAQDTFMRKKRLSASVGGWSCEALIDDTGTVKSLTSTFHPFFDRGYYEAAAFDLDNDEVSVVEPNQIYSVVR